MGGNLLFLSVILSKTLIKILKLAKIKCTCHGVSIGIRDIFCFRLDGQNDGLASQVMSNTRLPNKLLGLAKPSTRICPNIGAQVCYNNPTGSIIDRVKSESLLTNFFHVKTWQCFAQIQCEGRKFILEILQDKVFGM